MPVPEHQEGISFPGAQDTELPGVYSPRLKQHTRVAGFPVDGTFKRKQALDRRSHDHAPRGSLLLDLLPVFSNFINSPSV